MFDFGGVLAEEGFRRGLVAIADRSGLDPEAFFHTATETIYACGYVEGSADEAHFWELLRSESGISGTDQELTKEILDRFILRPQMVAYVKDLRAKGYITTILSDRTDWLDRLNARDNFFHYFDAVYNSYHMGKTKRDRTLFTDILSKLNLSATEALFVDDNPGNIDRASSLGLQTHLFTDQDYFFSELKSIVLP